LLAALTNAYATAGITGITVTAVELLRTYFFWTAVELLRTYFKTGTAKSLF